jgi:hypothetical protein
MSSAWLTVLKLAMQSISIFAPSAYRSTPFSINF